MKIITPKIYLECNLIFDNDISMNEITKEVGFVPTSFKDKKDQIEVIEKVAKNLITQ